MKLSEKIKNWWHEKSDEEKNDLIRGVGEIALMVSSLAVTSYTSIQVYKSVQDRKYEQYRKDHPNVFIRTEINSEKDKAYMDIIDGMKGVGNYELSDRIQFESLDELREFTAGLYKGLTYIEEKDKDGKYGLVDIDISNNMKTYWKNK